MIARLASMIRLSLLCFLLSSVRVMLYFSRYGRICWAYVSSVGGFFRGFFRGFFLLAIVTINSSSDSINWSLLVGVIVLVANAVEDVRPFHEFAFDHQGNAITYVTG